MATNQPGYQETVRHEQNIDRIVEQNQKLKLAENHRAVEAANQNSAIARIVNIVYYLFGVVEVILVIRVLLHLVAAIVPSLFKSLYLILPMPLPTSSTRFPTHSSCCLILWCKTRFSAPIRCWKSQRSLR